MLHAAPKARRHLMGGRVGALGFRAITETADAPRCARIRGTVMQMREQGAMEHLRGGSLKHTGTQDSVGPPGQARVTVLIRPDGSDAKP